MYILAIDTSCDETSVAISNDRVILANIISSQVNLHIEWGGVVPSIAQRAHTERIEPAIKEALKRAGLTIEEIDAFAVTYGPGLAIALEVGIRKAKELASTYSKPLVAVNHMAGHVYANLASTKTGKSSINNLDFPTLALLVSGNHTEIVLMRNHLDFEILGATVDDAMGEAYDKVARMLNLGYPGGPIVADLADQGDQSAFKFPIPMKQSGDLNFSFSGLKTAVLYTIRDLKTLNGGELTKDQVVDIAASFQAAAFQAIIGKLITAVKQYQPKQIILGGGVMANTQFRKAIRNAVKPYAISLSYPNLKKLCTDNAAMIAIAAYYQLKAGDVVKDIENLDRDPAAHL